MFRLFLGIVIGMIIGPYLPADFWQQLVVRFADSLQYVVDLIRSLV